MQQRQQQPQVVANKNKGLRPLFHNIKKPLTV
ncbi:hypothetical protein [Klebsiella phage vB_KpnS-VAC2]|uniref:Uncharacterized protein n=1 Tax=Klebsiella phage vB_KpnS-VAC2 TaxID=2864369 RepID=A0AAE8BXU2_9CAUD|nr:hypothetical protein [Klebsiella phage vB_KpnS-VAC2]